MKADRLMDALGKVKEDYIMESAPGQARKNLQKIQANTYRDQDNRSKTTPLRRALLIAAIIATLLLLVGCVAMIMGLNELKIGNFTYKTLDGEIKSGDFISLQGYIDSDNYKATQEWNQFLAQYDPDGSLLKEAEEIGYIPHIDYMAYLCYTQDMVKQIDDICSKYNLELLGPTYGPTHPTNASTEILTPLGIDTITASGMGVGVGLSNGYYYRDGSFALEGDLNFSDGDNLVAFQYRCIMKTSFDGVALGIGNSEAYDQWNYTVTDGTKVLLALSEHKALIIADGDRFFITINILMQHMTKNELEAAADAFIFNYSPQRPDPDLLVEPEWYQETITEETTEPDSTANDVAPTEIIVGKTTIDDVVAYYQAKYPDKEIKSVFHDFDGNGFGDLAVWYDGAFWSIYVTDEEYQVKAEYLINNGFNIFETYAQMEQQVQYAGNLIGIIEKKGNATYQRFCWLGESFYLRECFKFDPDGTDSQYFVSVLDSWDTPYDSEITQWTPLTEAEYMERLGAYTIQAHNLKPLAEYYLQ